MLRRVPLCLAVLAACTPVQIVAPPPNGPPVSKDDDTARHIERVEHGLYPGAAIAGEPGQSIDDRMRAHHVRGVSLAVIQDFHVAWAKGYGFADAEAKAPVTDATLFQAGSISKPVAAMAALRMVQDGKLSLDTKINDVLASWKLPDNDLTRATPVTLRMLLSHTGGTTVHGFPGYAAGAPIPTIPQVLDGAPPANTAPVRVDLAPGKEFRYSGGGITIMQEALVDLTHQPFPELMAHAVLEPIGMEHSTYEQPLPAARLPSAAAAYDPFGDPVAGKRHAYPEMAAAGLWTTPSDLARFAIELALEDGGKSSRVLSRATAERMLTKVAPVATDVDIGLGIFLENHAGNLYFEHDGQDWGFVAKLSMNPKTGSGLVVMANSDDSAILEEVLGSVSREYAWAGFPGATKAAKVQAPRLAELAGRYQVHADRVWRIEVEGDHLALSTPALPRAALVPTSEATFVSRADATTYTFSKGADGHVELHTSPPASDWPFAKRVADDFTVALDDADAGRVDQAAERYRAARAKEPSNDAFSTDRLIGLGAAAAVRGDFATAMRLCRVVASLEPDAMVGNYCIAEVARHAGDKAQAITSYRKALATADKDKAPAPVKEELRRSATEQLKALGASP